jgi:hypothetical protein
MFNVKNFTSFEEIFSLFSEKFTPPMYLFLSFIVKVNRKNRERVF